MRALFITGGTGFIGRRLLGAIDAAEYRAVTCLSRSGQTSAERGTAALGIQIVRGDLRNPDSYTSHLAGCDTVLHLAAATGRTSREDAFSINANGTRALVQECRRHGVRDFLLVSTIAVKYPNTHHYAYARAKQEAETAVRESGLRHVIVRPTIVLGPEAPIWHNILGLARRRRIVMPGQGRVRVQPIFVDDLVAGMITVVRQDLFQGGIYELGGPDVTSFEELLRRVHRLWTGREPAVMHLPLLPIIAGLSALEPVLGRRLPVTAGQLFAFRYDSTADPARALPCDGPRGLALDDMIQRCLADA
jgi:NADH dehydrogenase